MHDTGIFIEPGKISMLRIASMPWKHTAKDEEGHDKLAMAIFFIAWQAQLKRQSQQI